MSDAPRPLQRLVMVTGILAAAGPIGRPASDLAEAVGYRGTPESRREQLARLMRELQAVGIEVENVAPAGQEARWVLRPGDSRFRLAFTADQQAELARAALLLDGKGRAGVPGPGAPEAASPGRPAVANVEIDPPRLPVDVDLVLAAVTARGLLRFTYNGRARELDPVAMQRGAGGWAVSGVERESGEYRTFFLARMTHVSAGLPGTARDVSTVVRSGPDPLTWPVDPPLEVTLDVAPGYEQDVRQLLGTPLAPWTYRVTNRWIFFARLAELGDRVVLTGPEPVRAEFARFLRRAAS